MSKKNRDKDEDRYNTRQMVNKDPENFSEKNWLDHSGGAAKIDSMLLKGASYNELESSGRKNRSLKNHLTHLKDAHGLSIEKNYRPKIQFSSIISVCCKYKNAILDHFFHDSFAYSYFDR